MKDIFEKNQTNFLYRPLEECCIFNSMQNLKPYNSFDSTIFYEGHFVKTVKKALI